MQRTIGALVLDENHRHSLCISLRISIQDTSATSQIPSVKNTVFRNGSQMSSISPHHIYEDRFYPERPIYSTQSLYSKDYFRRLCCPSPTKEFYTQQINHFCRLGRLCDILLDGVR